MIYRVIKAHLMRKAAEKSLSAAQLSRKIQSAFQDDIEGLHLRILFQKNHHRLTFYDERIKPEMEKLLHESGWFVFKEDKSDGPINWTAWIIYPEHTSQEQVSGTLYHITPLENVESIKSQGITLQTGKSTRGGAYKPRIYLSKSPEAAKTIADLLDLEGYHGHKMKYALVSVDTSKLPDHAFQTDTKMNQSVFTTSPIPASAILGIKALN